MVWVTGSSSKWGPILFSPVKERVPGLGAWQGLAQRQGAETGLLWSSQHLPSPLLTPSTFGPTEALSLYEEGPFFPTELSVGQISSFLASCSIG